MVLWEPAKVWIWMERTKKGLSWLGVLIEPVDLGVETTGSVVGKIFQQKESNFSVGFVSKPPIYKHQSVLFLFPNFCGKKTSYSWGFTSTLVHSIATWLPKMQVLQIGMTNWPILTWWRGSSSWMPSVPRGFEKCCKEKARLVDQQKDGVEKKTTQREKGPDRYPPWN